MIRNNIKSETIKFLRLAFFGLLLSTSVNCGEDYFRPKLAESDANASASESDTGARGNTNQESPLFNAENMLNNNSKIYSLQPLENINPNKLLSFAVNPSDYPSNTKSEWSYKFYDGDSANCELQSGITGWTFRLRCQSPGILMLDLKAYLPNGKLSRQLAPVEITAAWNTPPDPQTPPPPDGAALYTARCTGCHGPLATSAKKGRTATQITNAIKNQNPMKGLSFLTAAEIQAISDALK